MADQVKLNMTIDLKRATSSWNENKFLFLLKQLHYKMPSNSHKIKTVAVCSLSSVKNMEGAIWYGDPETFGHFSNKKSYLIHAPHQKGLKTPCLSPLTFPQMLQS